MAATSAAPSRGHSAARSTGWPGCDSPASHNEENLGNNKYHFKNKSNEKEKDSNDARPALRNSAGGVGRRRLELGQLL